MLDYKSLDNKFYVRIVSDHKQAALERAEKLFGKLEMLHRDGEAADEAAFITEAINESKFEEYCSQLAEVAEIKGTVRVLNY